MSGFNKTTEEKLDKIIRDKFQNSVPKYYKHTLRVVKNMKNILKKDNIGYKGNPNILIPSAYLHDIGYAAPYKNDFVGNIENQEVKIKVHSIEGEKISKEILKELGFTAEDIKDISLLVSAHHRTDIPDKNLDLLLKADKLF